jgi:hypothetical protein
VEFTFNIYGGSPGGVGFSFGTNGANGNPYASASPVDISSGDPIAISIIYNNGAATLSLTDTNTLQTFTKVITTGNLPNIVGATAAYVGFTGADGGIASTQSISDFVYVPLTSLSAYVSGGNLILTWPIEPAGYKLQFKSDVTGGTWQDLNAQVTQVGGVNQASVLLSASHQFYRLVISVPAQ